MINVSNNNKLVRPYRVGVACAPATSRRIPANPPDDPENPRWENLASAIGNQYINEGKVLHATWRKAGSLRNARCTAARYFRHLPHRDDHINNPNAINAIFLLAERERIAAPRKWLRKRSLCQAKKRRCVPHS